MSSFSMMKRVNLSQISLEIESIRNMSFEYKYAKEYLKQHYKVKEYEKEHPNGTVRIDWLNAEGLSREEWKQSCMNALHQRINSKGGLDISHRENLTEIWRDGQIFLAQKQGKKSVYGDRFYSQYFRRRF